LGAERREEEQGEERWRMMGLALYIRAEGEGAPGD
jgi:hypothetical protein